MFVCYAIYICVKPFNQSQTYNKEKKYIKEDSLYFEYSNFDNKPFILYGHLESLQFFFCCAAFIENKKKIFKILSKLLIDTNVTNIKLVETRATILILETKKKKHHNVKLEHFFCMCFFLFYFSFDE